MPRPTSASRLSAPASIALAAAALLLTAAAPARAQDSATHSRFVRISDLDLTTQAGRTRLHQRVVAAAHDVCEADAPFGTPDYQSAAACIAQAEQRASVTESVLAARAAERAAHMTRTVQLNRPVG
jgi:UrcA family protein